MGKIPTTNPAKQEGPTRFSPKALGMKSLLVNDGTFYMTAVVKNKTVVEKKIKADDRVEAYSASASPFDVKPRERDYRLQPRRKLPKEYEGKEIISSADKIDTKPRTDIIRRKAILEQRYFGKTFNDNVHIQLIYNILDIRKILTVYANNIIYMLNNMRRIDTVSDDTKDIFGDISFRSSIDESKYADLFCFPQLAYFGPVFYKISKNNATPKIKEEIFSIFQILGTLRQICSHEEIQMELNGDPVLSEQVLYNVNTWAPQFLNVLSGFYSSGIRKLNNDFIKNNSKRNFYILEQMYPKERLSGYINQYYDFTVRKSYKNLGLSVKNLREEILKVLESKRKYNPRDYESTRSKLNQFLDFAIVRHLSANSDYTDSVVDELRLASKNDALKSAVYIRAAEKVWNQIQASAVPMMDLVKQNEVRNIRVAKDAYKNIQVNTLLSSRCSEFSQLIYFITLFLDGKEINDLLTTLVEKFDNIESFNKITRDLSIFCPFAKNYTLFENAGGISSELRVINSFSRMQKALPSAKKQMYLEALTLFGFDASKEPENYLDSLLCLESREATVHERDAKNPEAIAEAFGAYLPKKTAEREKALETILRSFDNAKAMPCAPDYVKKRMNVKISDKTEFRNFIANNVIESSRFQYLVRYNNPKTVHMLSKNANVVKFQLGKLPPDQLKRYFDACLKQKPPLIGNGELDKDTVVSQLAKIITDIDYKEFENVEQRVYKAGPEKQKKQAIISLYLTMLYLLTKNLVYVNSRYVMAFSALDRDSHLYGINVQKSDGKEASQYLHLTKHFLDNNILGSRPTEYIAHDLAQTNEIISKKFRDKVCHLNPIQAAAEALADLREVPSYYACYHYCLQKLLIKDYINSNKSGIKKLSEDKQGRFKDFQRSVECYKSYSKDFVKALCAPFGYNVARFKNLSIEGLFDKNQTEENNKKHQQKTHFED